MSIKYIRKRNKIILGCVIVISFMIVFCIPQMVMKKTAPSTTIAVSPVAVEGKEVGSSKFKTYYGNGHYITYQGKDFLVIYEADNFMAGGKKITEVGIYSLSMEGDIEAVYVNEDCGVIRNMSLSGDWIYFLETSVKEKMEGVRGGNVYISKVKVDGSGYQKILKRDVVIFFVDGKNIYIRDTSGSSLLCYNQETGRETQIMDDTTFFWVNENILYSWENSSHTLSVMDSAGQTGFEIKGICEQPVILYDGYVYYSRSKSRSDAFKKKDEYYLCRKELRKGAEEEILYSTNLYIFGYVVFDDFFVISKGIVKNNNDLCGRGVENKNNTHASLVKVEFATSKEKEIRSDLSYAEIHNTPKRIYFAYEKWNGKRWVAYHSYLAVDAL